MAAYKATITWKRNGANFTDNRYKRAHLWQFDGGVKMPASSSPHVVPLPYSDPSAVDPEEALLAAMASCHMLAFLSIAAKRGYIVDEYKDAAEAIMEKNSAGKWAITKAVLHPVSKYSANAAPKKEEDLEMHHEAHEECFIANSVRTEINIEPVIEE